MLGHGVQPPLAMWNWLPVVMHTLVWALIGLVIREYFCIYREETDPLRASVPWR